MAKVQSNKMDDARIKLNKLMVQYVITKDETLLPSIKKLEDELNYFNYGIKPR